MTVRPLSRMRRAVRRAAALGWLVAVLAAGCGLYREPVYRFARAATADGYGWEVYENRRWQSYRMTGVSLPACLAPHILRARGNRFIFRAVIDSSTGPVPTLDLRGWNICPPVHRQLAEHGPTDTTGAPVLTKDDFRSVADYQRCSFTIVAQFWPSAEQIPGGKDGSYLLDR